MAATSFVFIYKFFTKSSLAARDTSSFKGYDTLSSDSIDLIKGTRARDILTQMGVVCPYSGTRHSG